MKLAGKVALINGAASGMGRTGAGLFAREGAKVVVADINDDKGREIVQQIKEAGGDAYYIHADAGVASEMKKMIEEAVKHYGKLDIFWYNAGVPGPAGIEGVTEEDYDRSMDVNLKGGFFGVQYVLPELRKAGGGSILFTSSVSGIRAISGFAPYTCAKAALVHFTTWLAFNYGKENIRVNCICPGLIKTPIWDLADSPLKKQDASAEEYLNNLRRATPLGRHGEPEEIAATALFLVSDDSSFITGQIVAVDGGLSVYAKPV